MDLKEDQRIITDVAMFAANKFDQILDIVKNSHLNFQLQLSPYSAVISLKKTVIKDKSGAPVLPPTSYTTQPSGRPVETLIEKNKKLENELVCMQSTYDELVQKYNSACLSLSRLDSHIKQEVKVKTETLEDNKECHTEYDTAIESEPK